MIWEAASAGKRGRQPDYSDAAIQTCLTMKVLFCMALRRTTGIVKNQLRLINLDWVVPNFSRQEPLKVNIPFRGSRNALHLLIDSTGIKVEGEKEWNARKAARNGASGARCTSELVSKHWRSRRRSSRPAIWAARQCCSNRPCPSIMLERDASRLMDAQMMVVWRHGKAA